MSPFLPSGAMKRLLCTIFPKLFIVINVVCQPELNKQSVGQGQNILLQKSYTNREDSKIYLLYRHEAVLEVKTHPFPNSKFNIVFKCLFKLKVGINYIKKTLLLPRVCVYNKNLTLNNFWWPALDKNNLQPYLKRPIYTLPDTSRQA